MASEDPPWILAVVEAAVYNDKRKYSVEIRKVEQERPKDIRIIVKDTTFFFPPALLAKHTNYFVNKLSRKYGSALPFSPFIVAHTLPKDGFWRFWHWVELVESSEIGQPNRFLTVDQDNKDDVGTAAFAEHWGVAKKLKSPGFKNSLINATIDLDWEYAVQYQAVYSTEKMLFGNIVELITAGFGNSLVVRTSFESLAYWYVLNDSGLDAILAEWRDQPYLIERGVDLFSEFLNTVKAFEKDKKRGELDKPVVHVCKKWHIHGNEEEKKSCPQFWDD